MGAEKELEPGGQDKDNTHVVQATDGMGRTVSRDAFKSQEEAEAHATELKAQGHKVDVSPARSEAKTTALTSVCAGLHPELRVIAPAAGECLGRYPRA